MTETAGQLRKLAHQLGAGEQDVIEWYERYDEVLREYLLQRALCTGETAEKIADEAFIHLCFARAAGPIDDPRQFLFATARLLASKIELREKRKPQ